MPVAENIRKLGFRRWHERQLIEAHASLVTAFMCLIVVFIWWDQWDWRDPGIGPLVNLMLIGAGLQTLLLGALWYAPLLVAWHGLSASKAAFFSAAAAWINWRAFLVYGVTVMSLFGFVLMLALGGAMLLGGSGAGPNTAGSSWARSGSSNFSSSCDGRPVAAISLLLKNE